MKKIYKTPMISVTEVHAATAMLAASDMRISNTETTEQWVKGDNASNTGVPQQHYNVWDDDWIK